jgi:hypothetical protein
MNHIFYAVFRVNCLKSKWQSQGGFFNEDAHARYQKPYPQTYQDNYVINNLFRCIQPDFCRADYSKQH